jgi:glucokinase
MPAGFIAGVDLGASNVRVVITNQDGEVEARRSFRLPPGTPEDVVFRIGRTIDELARGVWVGAKVDAIGIVLPGTIDPDAGVVASIANMPGWDRVELAKLLGAPRGVPVAMENDANAAAIGEGWLGAAKGLRDFVFIALGTGIGAGLVLDGRLHRGAHLLAGEIAFFPMTPEQLRAGDWEHSLESVVGGRAASARAVELLGIGSKASDLFDAARAGEPHAASWLAETQEYLAMAVTDMIALLDPQTVVFGGGVVHAQGESLIAPVREKVHKCAPYRTPIVLSTLGEDAQVFGAVKLALDMVFA